jgi:FkbM family methyltransferase
MNSFKSAMIAVLRRMLPKRVRNTFFRLSFHLANEEFTNYAYHYAHAPDMGLGLAAMAARGFCPKTVVDAGAFEGNWSRLARQIWPASRLLMVEPNVGKRDALLQVAKDLRAELICELLGAKDGLEVQFFVMESGSSIMAERSPLPRVAETRRLRTLDSLLKKVERPAFLKIDAQGYELQILEGAARLLEAFEAVLLEVAIIEINEGAPLLHDVTAYMKAHGFVAYDILEIHRRPLDKALNQVDIVFVREDSRLVADKRHFA